MVSPKNWLQKAQAAKLGQELGFKADFVHVGEGLYASVQTITPAQARRILAERNTKNRKIKEGTVRRYAQDLLENRWRLTHEGIAFTISGILGNGQHRLEAVVKSGKPMKVLVFLGLAEDDAAYIDEGAIRKAYDASQILGLQTTKAALEASKAAYNGYDGMSIPVSNPKAIALAEDYSEGIQWCNENLEYAKGVTTTAIARGVLLRAYYFYRHNPAALERIKAFCKICKDGQYGNRKKDVAAFLLRERLTRGEKFFGRQRALYGMVEKAVVMFVNEEATTPKKFTPAKEELFRINGEGMPITRETDANAESGRPTETEEAA